MFGLFKKKEKVLPPFETLQNSEIKNHYFSRTSQWDWMDSEHIQIVDNNSPRLITLDPWPQMIFTEADGQKSISEYVNLMANQYGLREKIPQELDETILNVIQQLKTEGLISISEQATTLPYYLGSPQSELDTDKAELLMKEDGFLD